MECDMDGIVRECRRSIRGVLNDVDDMETLRRIFMIVLAAKQCRQEPLAPAQMKDRYRDAIEALVRGSSDLDYLRAVYSFASSYLCDGKAPNCAVRGGT